MGVLERHVCAARPRTLAPAPAAAPAGHAAPSAAAPAARGRAAAPAAVATALSGPGTRGRGRRSGCRAMRGTAAPGALSAAPVRARRVPPRALRLRR